jgi:hypothetical protein
MKTDFSSCLHHIFGSTLFACFINCRMMFKLLTDSLFLAICRSNWLHSRKYGTVWYHLASSRFLSDYFHPLSVSGKIDWHDSGFNARATCVKPADSACCLLGVRCRFYVNTLFGMRGGTL